MSKTNPEILFIQIITIFILAMVIIKLLKMKKSLKYVKRVGTFGIDSITDNDISVFDKLNHIVFEIIKSISKLLTRLKIWNKSSKRFEKYISSEKLKKIKPIDFISLKFLIAIAFSSLYLVNCMFLYENVNHCILLALFILSYFSYDVFLKFKYAFYKKSVENDLLKAVIIMNNSFQSGNNISQAINVVISQLDGPIVLEFKKIAADISYGLNIDEIFDRFYSRVKIADVKYIATSLSIINKTGGNITRVFKTIEKSIVEQKKLRDEINMLTSSSMLMYKILIIIPIVLVIFFQIIDNGYFYLLFTNPIGLVILFVTIELYIGYIIIIRKIMKGVI